MPDERDHSREPPPPWIQKTSGWEYWFLALSPDEQRQYVERYPEPSDWQDFYRFVLNREP